MFCIVCFMLCIVLFSHLLFTSCYLFVSTSGTFSCFSVYAIYCLISLLLFCIVLSLFACQHLRHLGLLLGGRRRGRLQYVAEYTRLYDNVSYYIKKSLCHIIVDYIILPYIIHPVSVRRFPSFRTQPLENLSRYQ